MPLLQTGVGFVVTKNTNEESIRHDRQIQHWHCVSSYEQRLCPWYLNQFTPKLTLWAKFMLTLHPMSKVHTLADLCWWGCLSSPLSIGGTVLPMLMSSATENWPWAFCYTGSLEYSTPGVPCWYLGRVLHLWLVHTVILQHRVCDGNIDSHMLAAWLLGKCHMFLCCFQ